MPSELGSQARVYSTVTLGPFVPGASPTPTPSPAPARVSATPTQTVAPPAPSPSSAPNASPSASPKPSSGGHGGAIAGGIIGTLVGLALIGAGFYGYRRWKDGGARGRYARFQVSTSADGDAGLLDRYAGGRVAGTEAEAGSTAYAPL